MVTALSAGGDHSRFVQADGSLWAMGRNHVGQLGDGTTTDRASPVKVVNSGVANVASGLSHGYYLTTGGDLWAMGLNADGQLGMAPPPTGIHPCRSSMEVMFPKCRRVPRKAFSPRVTAPHGRWDGMISDSWVMVRRRMLDSRPTSYLETKSIHIKT